MPQDAFQKLYVLLLQFGDALYFSHTSSWAFSVLQVGPKSTRTTLSCPGAARTPLTACLSTEKLTGAVTATQKTHATPSSSSFLPPPASSGSRTRDEGEGEGVHGKAGKDDALQSRTTEKTRNVQLQTKPLLKKRHLKINIFAFVHFYCTLQSRITVSSVRCTTVIQFIFQILQGLGTYEPKGGKKPTPTHHT